MGAARRGGDGGACGEARRVRRANWTRARGTGGAAVEIDHHAGAPRAEVGAAKHAGDAEWSGAGRVGREDRGAREGGAGRNFPTPLPAMTPLSAE